MSLYYKKEKFVISSPKKDYPYVLATDLDGTFLETTDSQKDKLYQFINDNPDMILVFVTGRNTEVILPILDDMFIPNPHYIIGDVGATAIHGETLEPIHEVQNPIAQRWQETLDDIKDIEGLDDIERQPVPQERRMSFFVNPKSVPHDKIEELKKRKCNVIYSNEIYLDILPHNTNKGATLKALINHLEIPHENVMVAGDTINDLSMYETGYKGVVLNNAEQPLKEQTRTLKNVYYSDENGTDGIIEALQHFKMAKKGSDDDELDEYGTSDLVMVYHRLPYREVEEDGKIVKQKHASPNGILPTLLGFFSEEQKGSWVAWSYADNRDPEDFEEHAWVDREKYKNLKVNRIPLTKDDVRIFYEVFSKESFWLLLHSFHEKVKFNHKHWEHFLEINKIFAERAAKEAAENATVWIHDYNLWMVPAYLRQLRPDVKIAFYHHTPFPSADIFNMVPWRREIIASLLQCDYIGFHIPQYVDNFVNTVRSNYKTTVNEKTEAAPRFKTYGCAIGVDRYVTSLTTELNTVCLGAHPVGINTKYVSELAQSRDVETLCDKINEEMGDRKLIVSVERTDYTKGPIEKLKAFERFLETHPDVHEKVALIMVCTPPAKGMKIYEEISQDIAYHVGLINGRFGTFDWTPIQFISRMIPFEDVIAYYRAADIGWVTPLRDGLNLVAKEYVMTKHASETNGALVLSEFAGAAAELHGAYLVNPYDINDMSETLYKALNEPEYETKSRIQRMSNIVTQYDVNAWGEDFLTNVRTRSNEHIRYSALESDTKLMKDNAA